MKQKIHEGTSMFRALLEYLRPVASRDLVGVVALIGHSYLIVIIPSLVKHIINGLEGDMTHQALLHYCLYIVGLSISAALLLFFARWTIIGASRQIEQQMRNDLLKHISYLSPRFYHNIKTGDLVTRFASDIEQVRLLVGPGVMYPGQTIMTTTLALYSMFMLDSGLTFLLLGLIFILLIFVNFNTRRLHMVYRQAQEFYSDMSAKVQENFNGIRVIKAYCQEEAEYERFRELSDKFVDRNIEQIKLRGLLFPVIRFIAGVGTVAILWIGGMKVIDGNLTLGDLVQFAIYYQMLMWPIIALGWIINVIHRGAASWRRIKGILATQPEVVVDKQPDQEDRLHGEIEVRNFTFSYSETMPPVLKNISFHVYPGQTLAIVGPTGCGKTTIVNLLLHLYQLPRGCIFYDGRDINDIPLETLKNSIAYVSQEVFLFSDTIRSNILFGVPETVEMPEEELNNAAERAQLAEDLKSFPNQMETEIGERGITLSGGQKQRTGIARALILNRPILILDDCLSAVDTDTEEAILRGMKSAIHQSTAIIISHRISTVKYADHIIVLDEGEIVEEGSHEELVDHEGLYARIYKRQLLEESLGIRS